MQLVAVAAAGEEDQARGERDRCHGDRQTRGRESRAELVGKRQEEDEAHGDREKTRLKTVLKKEHWCVCLGHVTHFYLK